MGDTGNGEEENVGKEERLTPSLLSHLVWSQQAPVPGSDTRIRSRKRSKPQQKVTGRFWPALVSNSFAEAPLW